MLRLRGAELESRMKNATRELKRSLAQRRALVKRLLESRDSLLRAANGTPGFQPQPKTAKAPRTNQRGSAR